MRRLLALMAVVALVVAFALPMVDTADAASHGNKDKMNPCEVKAKAKDMMKKGENPCAKNPCAKNPCGKTMNPCDAKAKAKEMMNKANPCKSKQ